MPGWVMWLITVAVVAAPIVLMVLFNGDDTADSRGQRISRRWRS